jgi:hypothetical protein
LSLGVGTSLGNIARPWLLLKMFSWVCNSCAGGFVVTYSVLCLVHSFHYFLSSPTLFLKWHPQISTSHIHTCAESASAIFTLLHPIHLPSPPILTLPFRQPVLRSCPYCFVRSLISGLCLGVLSINISYFKSVKPSLLL